ncbi:MAG: hypothetical protein DI555_04555 [Novosphingobium pentaromativorans]|uniref:Uncharacterized protein n=1 Tax=Novosphingobium pentaromativorans TaxID=205844 RepID=A0A2W5NT57_9SPHN|nr:MAG: hypothetical protein DI555_04555 [Novosphingobium pentaromativorans]
MLAVAAISATLSTGPLNAEGCNGLLARFHPCRDCKVHHAVERPAVRHPGRLARPHRRSRRRDAGFQGEASRPSRREARRGPAAGGSQARRAGRRHVLADQPGRDAEPPLFAPRQRAGDDLRRM